ncbi:hypothetical protein EIY89_06910 [Shewanella algae]|nr:hypothetical protein EIY89_06910 [Shewanella algae]
MCEWWVCLAIDLIAQTGLSSLPVIYYLEQLFSGRFITSVQRHTPPSLASSPKWIVAATITTSSMSSLQISIPLIVRGLQLL